MKSLSVLAFACILATGAYADTITFDFNSTTPNASLGTTSHTYTEGGLSITASSSTDLFFKVGGGDETGLGLACCDSDHEINPGQSISFDLSSLFSANVTGITITVGSIQPGETASLCDLDLCLTFDSSENGMAVSILSLYEDMVANHSGQLTISGVTGDVLVDQLQVTTATIPEPNTLLLLGTGVFMLAGVARRALA